MRIVWTVAATAAVAAGLGIVSPAQGMDQLDNLDKCEGYASPETCATGRSWGDKLKEADKYIFGNKDKPSGSNTVPAVQTRADESRPVVSDGTEEAQARARVKYLGDRQIAARNDEYRHALASIRVRDASTLERLNANCTNNSAPGGDCLNDVDDARKVNQEMEALLAQPGASAYLLRVLGKPWMPESPARAAKVKNPLDASPAKSPQSTEDGTILRRGANAAADMQSGIAQAEQWERDRPAREAQEAANWQAAVAQAAAYEAAAPERARVAAEAQRRKAQQDADDSAAFSAILGGVVAAVGAHSNTQGNTAQHSVPQASNCVGTQAQCDAFMRGDKVGCPDDSWSTWTGGTLVCTRRTY